MHQVASRKYARGSTPFSRIVGLWLSSNIISDEVHELSDKDFEELVASARKPYASIEGPLRNHRAKGRST